MGADKKIELQDIEDDNLKSEKKTEYDTAEQQPQISDPSSGLGLASLDFLKNGFPRYFVGHPQSQVPQRSQYVHQYDVTEQPERHPAITSKLQYGPAVHRQQSYPHQQQIQQPQQAMVSYLSNVPMQIYLVPQYYNEASGQGARVQSAAQYTTSGGGHVSDYPTGPEAVQTQNNYEEVPTYVAPVQKTYMPHYSSQPVSYVSIAAPAVAPTPTIAPLLGYQVPVVQYDVGAQHSPKGYYYPHYTETNAVGEGEEGIDESPKHYTSTDISYAKSPANEYRYYSVRPHPRDEYRKNQISELPHPNSLLFKPSPPHLSHIPKALPIHRPLNKPVYGTGPNHPPVPLVLRQHEPNGVFPNKRRPTSLLDSYVPSSLQIEYMKRGFTNDPIAAYEALSSGRHFAHAQAPRHYERGFFPNQMYQTAGGSAYFGHLKRTPKIDKVPLI